MLRSCKLSNYVCHQFAHCPKGGDENPLMGHGNSPALLVEMKETYRMFSISYRSVHNFCTGRYGSFGIFLFHIQLYTISLKDLCSHPIHLCICAGGGLEQLVYCRRLLAGARTASTNKFSQYHKSFLYWYMLQKGKCMSMENNKIALC